MIALKSRAARSSGWLVVGLAAWGFLARADLLVGTNGERFSGKVVQETPDTVVFESELAGRLTLSRAKIRELQSTAPKPLPNAPSSTNLATAPNPSAATNQSSDPLLWHPPSLGFDGHDWLQLKSGEWLKGWLKYVQNKKVEFDSAELELLSLKLTDVRRLYTARPMFTKFEGQEQIYGAVVLSNDLVEVTGPEQLSLTRDQLAGITPGGEREIDFWSGKLTLGASLQSGNTKQASFNTSAELARRTPTTQVLLGYLGNYSEVNGSENANNHRINGNYDVRLNRDWFVRPVQLEYYRDPLANIAHRGIIGVGLGHYLFDRDTLEWRVAAGPAYQYTRFATVEAGEADTASTPAGVLQSNFKADITDRLKFLQTFSVTLSSLESGRYSHHAVTTLEFEIKRHLNLDVSFVWDYLQNPQAKADGVVPQHGDFYLTVGAGARF